MSLNHGHLLCQLFGHLNVSDSPVFFSRGGGGTGNDDKKGEDSACRQTVLSDLSEVYKAWSLS
jgi:hypothetical protein